MNPIYIIGGTICVAVVVLFIYTERKHKKNTVVKTKPNYQCVNPQEITLKGESEACWEDVPAESVIYDRNDAEHKAEGGGIAPPP